VTAGRRPAEANAGSAFDQSTASTTTNRACTCSIARATTSGAIIGLTGAATRPALAMPIIISIASTELSQNSSTRSPRSRPAAISAFATRFAVSSATR
jgi:hypothetical protein